VYFYRCLSYFGQLAKSSASSIIKIMNCHPVRIFTERQVLEEMICAICKGVMREPVTDSCGHAYGKRCIEAYVEGNGSCPINKRIPISCNQLSVCLPFKNVIGKLQVKCPNNDYCKWSGRLEQLESHTENDCSHEEVTCPNKNCGVKNPRWIMKDHLSNCQHRLSKCSLCESIVAFKDRHDHEDNCPEQSIMCPFQCGCQIKRKNIDRHFQMECGEVTIECEYKAHGCQHTGKRKEVAEHVLSITGSTTHMSLMLRNMSGWHQESLKTMNTIGQKVSKIEDTIEEIRRQLNWQSNPRTTSREPSHYRQERNNSFTSKESQETADYKLKTVTTDFGSLKQISLETQQGLRRLGGVIAETLSQQLKPKIDDIYISIERNRHLLFKNWKEKERDKSHLTNAICFDSDAKGGALTLISPKEVENIGSGMMALANTRLIPGKPVRFQINKQTDSLCAVGACIKKTAQDAMFLWPIGMNHGYYFFYASGDVLRNGKEGYFKPDGQKLTFGTGDQIEIQLDANCRKIVARNLSNKSFAEIALRDGETWKDLYPCVRIQQKGEAIKLVC
jgi:hypothetical protein